MQATVIVLAKAPVPGRCKTRLCPPCAPHEAAALAEAALADTLDAAVHSDADRVVLALDGVAGSWLPNGVDVIGQRGAGLDERIAAAFDDIGGPALLIGMDTPQVSARMLDGALQFLAHPHVDAVLGPALDGGWWAAGLRRSDAQAFVGVPMSTSRTGVAQTRRLRARGLRIARLPTLRDVDRIADAYAVAADAPWSRFAHAVASLPASRLAG